MKNKSAIGLLALLASLAATAYCQEGAAPVANGLSSPKPGDNFRANVAEVVKLSQSGFADNTVKAYISNDPSSYQLSANDTAALKRAGVSSEVIAAMISHDRVAKPRVPVAVQQAAPAPIHVPTAAVPTAAVPTAAVPTAAVPTAAVPTAAVPTAAVPTNSVANSLAWPSPVSSPLGTPENPLVEPALPAPAPKWGLRIVDQNPPAALPELIPAAPGPNYCWIPGHWRWNGTWLWVRGSWEVRPWHGAVWVRGHWGHHGRGMIWIGGRWR